MGSPQQRTLRRSSLAARLDAAVWRSVIGAGTCARLPARASLMREGDPPGRAFAIVDGWVRVVAAAADGRETLLALRGPGDLVGELAAFRRAERSASVRALTAVAAVRFSPDELAALLERQPQVVAAIVADLADRLVDAGQQLVSRETERSEERLCGLLRRLLEEAGRAVPGSSAVVVDLPLSQEDLGDLIGASRESVARALCRLRAAAVLATHRRSIVVLDPVALTSCP